MSDCKCRKPFILTVAIKAEMEIMATDKADAILQAQGIVKIATEIVDEELLDEAGYRDCEMLIPPSRELLVFGDIEVKLDEYE